MEYTVETRCLHLEEEKNKDKDFGSVSFPIYQTATFAHYGVGRSTAMIIRDCRIQRENSLKGLWLHWRAVVMLLPLPAVWQPLLLLWNALSLVII